MVSNTFYFHTYFWEMIPFDLHIIFQMGWLNHQLTVKIFKICLASPTKCMPLASSGPFFTHFFSTIWEFSYDKPTIWQLPWFSYDFYLACFFFLCVWGQHQSLLKALCLPKMMAKRVEVHLEIRWGGWQKFRHPCRLMASGQRWVTDKKCF